MLRKYRIDILRGYIRRRGTKKYINQYNLREKCFLFQEIFDTRPIVYQSLFFSPTGFCRLPVVRRNKETKRTLRMENQKKKKKRKKANEDRETEALKL